MFQTALAIQPAALSKAVKAKTPKPKLGFANGMVVLAIGPKGGKIVGWVHGKPVYGGSSAAKKLKAKKDAAKATKGAPPLHPKDSDHASQIWEWLEDVGIQSKGGGFAGIFVVSASDAQLLLASFPGLKSAGIGGLVKFKASELWQHVGEPLVPPPHEITAWSAKGASGADADPPFPDSLLATLKLKGNLGGSHGGKIVEDKNGNQYAWKTNGGQTWVSRAEEAFNRVASLVFPKEGLYPDAEMIEHAGDQGVLLSWVDNKGTIGNEVSGDHGTTKAKLQKHFERLVQHQVLDWMMSNHDSHGANFVETLGGDLAAIDKGQAFKAIGADKLSTSYKLNASSPAYNAMWKLFQNGEIKGDPIKAVTEVLLSIEKNLSVEQYHSIVAPYLEDAAQGLEDFEPKKKWALIEKRFKDLRSNWETFLSEMTGDKVTIPSAADEPAITPVEDKTEKIVDFVQTPGWPVTKGNVTVHAPGGEHPPGWPTKYPGPGYQAAVKMAGNVFEFGFDSVDGKPAIAVLFPNGTTKIYPSPAAAADSTQLFNKGLPLDMGSTEKKAKGIAYPATKLFALKQFEGEFQAAGTTSEPTIGSMSADELMAELGLAPEKKEITLHEMLAAVEDGIVTDSTLIPPAALTFAMEHAAISVPHDWPKTLPLPGSVIKILSADGTFDIWVVHQAAEGGAPLLKNVTVPSTGVPVVFGSTHPASQSLKSVLALPSVVAAAKATQTAKQPKPKPLPAGPAPQAEVTPAAKKVQTPKEVKYPKKGGPLPIGHKHELTKPFDHLGELKVQLEVLEEGFEVTIKAPKGDDVTKHKSLSAASDHVWLVQKGYLGKADYKAKTGKTKIASGGGWKFFGVKPKTGEFMEFANVIATTAEAALQPPGEPGWDGWKSPTADELDELPIGSVLGYGDPVAKPFPNSDPEGEGWVKHPDGWKPMGGSMTTALTATELSADVAEDAASGFGGLKVNSIGEPPPPPSSLAWQGSKVPTAAQLKALVFGTVLKDVAGYQYKKQLSGAFQTISGASYTVSDMIEHALSIEDQPGSPDTSGTKPLTVAELDALPVDAEINDGIDTFTKISHKDFPQGKWLNPKLDMVYTAEWLSSESVEWSVDLKGGQPVEAKDPTTLELLLAGGPPNLDPEPATPSITGDIGPTVVTTKEALPDFPDKDVVWSNATKLSGLPVPGKPNKTFGMKSPHWASWVPPMGVWLEGVLHGEKIWITPSATGYGEDGDASPTLKFVAIDEDGKIVHGAESSSSALALDYALADLMGIYNLTIAEVKAAFKLVDASFPQDVSFATYKALPTAGEAIGVHPQDIPPEQKNKVVVDKLPLAEYVALASVQEKYAAEFNLEDDSLYCYAKQGLSAAPTEALASFLADHALDWEVEFFGPGPSSGAWADVPTDADVSSKLYAAETTVAESAAQPPYVDHADLDSPGPDAGKKKLKSLPSNLKLTTVIDKIYALPAGVKLHTKWGETLSSLGPGANALNPMFSVTNKQGVTLSEGFTAKKAASMIQEAGGASVQWPGDPVKKKKKPKPLAPTVKKPSVDSEKVKKAKAWAAWVKSHPQSNKASDLLTLSFLQEKLAGLGYEGGLHVHDDGEGNFLIAGKDSAKFKEAVANWQSMPPSTDVTSPLGDMLGVSKDELANRFPGTQTIKGPDNVDYPAGTTFEQTEVTTKTVKHEVVADFVSGFSEEGLGKPKKIKPHDTDSDKIVIKFGGITNEAQAAAKQYLADKSITVHGEPMVATNTVFTVTKADLDVAVETTTVTTPKLPDLPPAFAQSAPPFALGPQKQGELAINNEADLGALDAIKMGHWGHTIRHGGAGLWINSQISVRRVANPDGEDFFEVTGDLLNFNPQKSKLSKGKIKYTSTTDEAGGAVYDVYDEDTGLHKKGDNVIEGGWFGFDGLTDGGSYVGVAHNGDLAPEAHGGLAMRNRFVARIPASKDVQTELQQGLQLAGIAPALAASAHDGQAERLFIKSQLVRNSLGAKGYWGASRKNYDNEVWLDSQLKKSGFDKYVDTARIKVGAGGAHTVEFDQITDADLKDVQFVHTGADSPGAATAFLLQETGVPSRKQGYTTGTAPYSSQAGSDVNTGGAAGVFTRIARKGGPQASGVHGYNTGSTVRYIYRPRILKRADYWAHNHDGYGSQAPAKSKPDTLNLNSSSHEVLFEHGVAHEDIAGVWCASDQVRSGLIETLTSAGKTEINNIPVADFFFTSPTQNNASINKACKGLKVPAP